MYITYYNTDEEDEDSNFFKNCVLINDFKVLKVTIHLRVVVLPFNVILRESKLPYRTKISADKIFRRTKFLEDKNFRRTKFLAVLYAEILSDKVYDI